MSVRLRLLAGCALALAGLGLLDSAPAVAQDKRVALVIGNAAYQHIGLLPNARSDAKSIQSALQNIGFAAELRQDLNYVELREAIRAFGRQTQDAEMALVYFAGHGMEAKGENWLLPTSAKLENESDLAYETVNLASIIAAVQGATRLRLVILDACRNNPFALGPQSRTVVRGLAPIEPSGDILVAYSAKHGTVAEDGPAGGMSPFAAGLQKHLPTPGLDIRILMGRVRDDVREATKGRQEPFIYGSVGGQTITLVAPPKAQSGKPGAEPTPGLSKDELAWLRATASSRLEAYRDYLNQFPGGHYQADAQAKIKRLTELGERWRVLQTSRDRIDIEAFVIEVAGTQFSELAKQRLIYLYQSEESDWKAAEDAKLWKDYSAFLAQWPRGRHLDDAEERLRELTDIKRAWEQLAASDDEPALDAFVRKHGWSEYGAAATSRLIALRRQRTDAGDDSVKTLSARALQQAIDGHALTLALSGISVTFDSKGSPAYRPRLGKDFFQRQFKQMLAGEGSFRADVVIDGRRQRLEGLGAVVKSQVDGMGSVFFLQMHGNEQNAAEVDRRDRRYAYLQVIQDYFGFVCIMTSWESILSSKNPERLVERCNVQP